MKKKKYLLISFIILLVSCNSIPVEDIYTNSSKPTDEVVESPTLKLVKDVETEVIKNPNTVGNSAGNISYSGFASTQDNWIYFINEEQSNKEALGIYRINDSTNEIQKITDDTASYINVVGEWIYYCNTSDSNKGAAGLGPIYKISIDGQRYYKLTDFLCSDVIVVNEWIYFTNASGSNIYKLKTDGTKLTQLNTHISQSINVVEDYIYFVSRNSIYRMTTDGKDTKLVQNDIASRIIVDGEWIYYSDKNFEKLFRIKTDGTNNTQLIGSTITGFNLYRDRICFSVELNGVETIYVSELDGKGKKKIAEGGIGCIVSDWNYYYKFYDEYYVLERCNLITGKNENVFTNKS